jgi:L-aminopeptidase/D-esterase-like protein
MMRAATAVVGLAIAGGVVVMGDHGGAKAPPYDQSGQGGPKGPPYVKGLTAVDGIRVGHHTLDARPTGCTVILAEAGAVAGVDVRGAAPGTRETDLLDPINTVQQVHAIVLSGGSAYGLDTATGVMRYLEEKQIGFPIGGGVVPIVPAAILFDLGVGNGKIRPDASCGYAAAQAASTGPVAEGNVGAGAGATVGKLARRGKPMKGGTGSASIELSNGLVVAALVAVNAIGNVVDPKTGETIAGARTSDDTGFVDLHALVRNPASGELESSPLQNTTLAVVATNAQLTKLQATRVAGRAQDGYARAIYPSHLSFDGDAIFAMATGTWKSAADVDQIGSLAADLVAEAIVRAVRAATSIPGYPAARDLKK